MDHVRISEPDCDCSALYERADPTDRVRLVPGTERTCSPCKKQGLRYDLAETRRNLWESPAGDLP